MAKLTVKNLRQVQTKIRKDLTKTLRSKVVRDGVVDIVVDEIQKESSNASAVTKKIRKYLERGNTTDPKYKRSKINITFTGELLRDLRKNIKARFTKGKAEYVIEHSGKKHKKYKNPKGKPIGKVVSYKKINEYLKNLGYDYLTFSGKSKNKVLDFVRKAIRKSLK